MCQGQASARPATKRHPFLVRVARYISLGDDDLAALWGLIEVDLTVSKRRDLGVDGYEHRKLSFVESGFAAATNCCATVSGKSSI